MKKVLLLAVAFAWASPAQQRFEVPAQQRFEVKVTGHGRPMILIPGLASSGDTWDGTVARYKDRYECHVLTVAGFAGVPRMPGPMLDKLREGIAAYVRDKKLEKPLIVGHSLGGYVALDVAAHYPELPGGLVIVDAYPFFAGLYGPEITLEQAVRNADQMRKGMDAMNADMYERYVKSGVAVGTMATKPSDIDRLIGWSLASDRTAVADAMSELFSRDLRASLATIKAPTLVMGSWIAYKDFTDRAKTEANIRSQYAKLSGVKIEITDTARHFIMWDDPEWMYARMDRFLALP